MEGAGAPAPAPAAAAAAAAGGASKAFTWPTYKIESPGIFNGQTICHPYFNPPEEDADFIGPQKAARLKAKYIKQKVAWLDAHKKAGGPDIGHEKDTGKPFVKEALRIKATEAERIIALRFLALASRMHRNPPRSKGDDEHALYMKYFKSGADNLDWQSVRHRCHVTAPFQHHPFPITRPSSFSPPSFTTLQVALNMLTQSDMPEVRAAVERLEWRNVAKWQLFTSWCREKASAWLTPDKETGNSARKKMDPELVDLLAQAYGAITAARLTPMGTGSGLPTA